MSTFVTHLPKEELHGVPSHSLYANYSTISSSRIKGIIRRLPNSLSFRNLETKFLLNREDYNTSCYGKLNLVN
jgi:hypothetical protein